MNRRLFLVAATAICAAAGAFLSCGEHPTNNYYLEAGASASADDDQTLLDDDTAEAPTWTDPKTRLVWAQPSSSAQPFDDAIRYCGIVLGSRWTLPTIEELRGLVRGCDGTKTGGACPVKNSCDSYDPCWNESCDGCGVRDGPGPQGTYCPNELPNGCLGNYWSKTTVPDKKYHMWYIHYLSGAIKACPDYHKENMHVLCVHSPV